MTSTFFEKDDTLNVTYEWHNSFVETSFTSHRGTLVEMVKRPGWGLTCYMDGVIQSCELDEKKYHQTLVEPILKSEPKTVCILGGGEGATAREVLTDPFISKVHMIEWDRDVVALFKTIYKKWSDGAFEDPRLTVEYEDVFYVCGENRSYDSLIIDLFEPEDMEGENSVKWLTTLIMLALWAKKSISIYAGMDDIFSKNNSVTKIKLVLEHIGFKNIVIQKVFIPSFMGEAVFISGSR
jgi:predicted membrane-bound spermidine synthase